MRYVSTRGQADPLEFEQVMMTGLARDGGLYVPDEWPRMDEPAIASLRGLSYAQAACRLMRDYIGAALEWEDVCRLVRQAYEAFEHRAVTPLVQIDANQWVMELFHGPTLAFKDVALQVLGRLYDYVLERRGGNITLIGATSGDTGSAAIEAVRGREHSAIFILHPHNRTSEIQRRQMTTVDAANVHNIAIEGTFDDCQALVKAMFIDHAFRDEVRMSGVNSINWARIMPQIVYYFTAAVALGAPDREVSFCVPTGNFGDIYAGYAAATMGLPVKRLVIATNVNDILTRALASGDHSLSTVTPTMSPSMDIQVSSNFERLLFDVHGRDGAKIRTMMQDLQEKRGFALEQPALERIRQRFTAQRVDERQTLATIKRVYVETGQIIDPHTAVGVCAAAREQERDPATPMVVLGTAHPAKFPAAVEKAIGFPPPLPPRLQAVLDKPERFDVLPNDLQAVMAHIRQKLH